MEGDRFREKWTGADRPAYIRVPDEGQVVCFKRFWIAYVRSMSHVIENDWIFRLGTVNLNTIDATTDFTVELISLFGVKD